MKMGNSEFDEFWEHYPKKVAKVAAKKSFLKLNKELLPDILKAIAIQKQSEQWEKDNGRFIPHPATWLNGERWNDDIKSFQAERKPYYQDMPMKQLPNGKWRVFYQGEWKDYGDSESKIVYK